MRLLRIANSRFWFLLALLTVAFCIVALSTVSTSARADAGELLTFHTRRRVERAEAGGQFQIEYKTVEWAPQKTALVICDMWNTMCCKIPADRVAELAVRMNDVVKAARAKGVLIIHSPSGNVDFYDGTSKAGYSTPGWATPTISVNRRFAPCWSMPSDGRSLPTRVQVTYREEWKNRRRTSYNNILTSRSPTNTPSAEKATRL